MTLITPAELDEVLADPAKAQDTISRMLHRSIQRSVETREKQHDQIARVGELNSRAIFMGAAGEIPVEIQEHVQSVLMPMEAPIKNKAE